MLVYTIATPLLAIYTIGLDSRGRQPGEKSAYSVFNKGFKPLAGTFQVPPPPTPFVSLESPPHHLLCPAWGDARPCLQAQDFEARLRNAPREGSGRPAGVHASLGGFTINRFSVAVTCGDGAA
jgi:hypothetical protein